MTKPAALQRDRRLIPYLGPLEDALRNAWVESLTPVRQYLRSDGFHSQLEAAMHSGVEATTGYLENHIDYGTQYLGTLAYPALERAVIIGATVPDDVLTKAASSAARSSAQRVLDRTVAARRAAGRFVSRLNIQPTSYVEPPSQHFASAYHIDAARTITANLVTHVSDTTKAKVRGSVTRAIRTGANADILGRQIANYVGLFPRWQIAVDNLYRNMLENDIPQRVADRRAAAYADELVAKRGVMIARTELMRAMNEGRLASYRDVADRRGIDSDTIVKTWVAAPDACPECQLMGDPGPTGDPREGVSVVGLDTPFETPYGPITVPPLHPHCRCTVNYSTAGADANDD